MSRSLEVITPEQVTIHYELAGFGSRALAAAVDYGLQLIIFLVLGVISFFSQISSFADHEDFWKKMDNSLVIGVIILVVFVITWGYFILFETLWNGMTPGKRLLRLRVIRDGGFPVDFRAVAIRNLLRAVDILPGVPLLPSYACGFVSILCHQHYKRLGDIAAGTVVVKHRQDVETDIKFSYGEAVVYRLLDANVLSQISRITREEYQMIKRFLDRRQEMPQPMSAEFAHRLAAPLIEKLAYKVPQFGMDYERWLDEIDLAYRTRALGITGVTPAHEEPAPMTPPAMEPPSSSSATRKW